MAKNRKLEDVPGLYDEIKLPPFWGHVELQVFRRGKFQHRVTGRNVITNVGKVLILQLMRAAPSTFPITRMEVGDGGCGAPFPATSSLFTPIAFTVTDTVLRLPLTPAYFAPLEAYNAGTDLNVGARTMKYTAIFSSAGAAGFHNGVGQPKVINEIALRSSDTPGVAVALRSFKSIPFDPTDAVDVRAIWTIGLP